MLSSVREERQNHDFLELWQVKGPETVEIFQGICWNPRQDPANASLYSLHVTTRAITISNKLVPHRPPNRAALGAPRGFLF